MDNKTCPPEEELLAVLAGDATEATTKHVAACSSCKKSLEVLQAEATVLQQIDQSELIKISAPTRIVMPTVIGKYIVVGHWDENSAFTTFRGLHAIVHQEVLIQWSKVPLCDDPATHELFKASLGTWMQRRPHVAPVLDSGNFESRPYIIVKFEGQPRLDRLHEDEQPDITTILRLFGQIATALSTSIESPHPFLGRSSIVLDDTGEATLIDWPAAMLFGSLTKEHSLPTVRLLAKTFWESFSNEPSHASVSSPEDLARLMSAKKIPARTAVLLSRAMAGPLDQLPTLTEIATALTPSASSRGWKRLLGR